MKILLLCEGDAETRDSWSGISKSVVDTLRAFGHEVRTGDVDLYGTSRWLGAGLSFSPQRDRWWVRYHLARGPFALRSRNAARIIASQPERPDVILQFGATFAPLGRQAVPYVLYCDSNIALARRTRSSGYGEAVPLREREIDAVERREAGVYREAAAICTISEYCARSFATEFGVPQERVRTIHAGPNFDLESVSPPASGPPTRPTVLFVGRQFERKGGDVLVRAFSRVRQRMPDAELVIVGPQRLEAEQPGVQFSGLLNKDSPEDAATLRRLYSQARVFCMPSRFDCFPISFLEAMAFGLPCVGTNIAGLPEIIVDGETGFVIPPEDEEALADRLLRLLGDQAESRRMGAAGRLRLESRFTWGAVVGRMLEAIELAVRR